MEGVLSCCRWEEVGALNNQPFPSVDHVWGLGGDTSDTGQDVAEQPQCVDLSGSTNGPGAVDLAYWSRVQFTIYSDKCGPFIVHRMR